MQGSTRALLGRLLDAERGVVPSVASTPCYCGREPAISQNPWADSVVQGLRQFGDQVAARKEVSRGGARRGREGQGRKLIFHFVMHLLTPLIAKGSPPPSFLYPAKHPDHPIYLIASLL